LSIITKDLCKNYGDQIAVNNLNIAIKEGEIVGFLGPNGAGKSTTMKMLTGYIPPSKGEGSVCGWDIVDDSLAIRKIVGYLPEHNPLYLDMYVREFLEFAGKMGGVSQTQKRVGEVIDLTGLDREKHKKIGQLSKGYRQRVGLAQAIIHDPDVLILDEPTGGLDPNQVIEIRELIKKLGKTTLLSTHIMQEVEAVCTRVVIIDKGNLVADSPIEKLANITGEKHHVNATFGSAINVKELSQLDEVIHVTDKGNNRYRIEVSSAEGRKSISHFALKNNLEVMELSSENVSLEQVFQNLTKHVDHL